MLESGIIKESGSEWASPMVLNHEKDGLGSLRLWIIGSKMGSCGWIGTICLDLMSRQI